MCVCVEVLLCYTTQIFDGTKVLVSCEGHVTYDRHGTESSSCETG